MDNSVVILIVGLILYGEWWLIRSMRDGPGDSTDELRDEVGGDVGVEDEVEGCPPPGNGGDGLDWTEWLELLE